MLSISCKVMQISVDFYISVLCSPWPLGTLLNSLVANTDFDLIHRVQSMELLKKYHAIVKTMRVLSVVSNRLIPFFFYLQRRSLINKLYLLEKSVTCRIIYKFLMVSGIFLNTGKYTPFLFVFLQCVYRSAPPILFETALKRIDSVSFDH